MIINVLEFLEASAAKYPDKVFLSDETHSVTFAEAEAAAKRIGTYLTQMLSARNGPIAVLAGRDVESLLMFFGVVYSGNFYVPLNPDFPAERLCTMLNTLRPLAILGKSEFEGLAAKLDRKFFSYETVCAAEANQNNLNQIRRSAIDTDPLYAIFTSGSTGIPKAVLIAHRSVIDLADAFHDTFRLDENAVFGNQAPFDFDMSVKDIYSAMRNSGTVEIIPKQMFSFPVKLIQYLNEKKVTHAFWAVAALCVVANLRGMKKIRPLHLKTVLFGGEVMPIKALNYWQDNLPDTAFYNVYGPTEITVNCTYFPVRKRYEAGETVPMGVPFRNTDILVLNEEDRPVKPGEEGELCVRGTCLALGYYNNPEKTAEVFTQNPLNNLYPERIYRTGDLVRYDEDSQLVYCGRKDFQIKHMGYRIELGDIEAAADRAEWVGRSCCLYDREHGKIVLFYEAAEERNAELAKTLESKLPRYMLPSRYIHFERLPSNSHGKIDRKGLEAEYFQKG